MSADNVLALTMGDPAGIGPEVCLKALDRWPRSAGCNLVFGDADILDRLGRTAGLTVPPASDCLDDALALADSAGAAIFHIDSLDGQAKQDGLSPSWQPGVVSPSTGKASYAYIMHAIEAAQNKWVSAVVTGPIHKEALRLAGVAFPGHTEIFETLTGASRACMMLTSDALTCSFVTTHIGLCDVPAAITTRRVLDVIELTDQAMRKIRGRPPKLVVCGLNPHSGERGLFGDREEERLILPAIEQAQQRGIAVQGPVPPDAAFLPARRASTDAYICMYHDQGHIPLKALSFETAVNTTLGLSIVRTSVDHGTAFDIAWQRFDADATSMVQAMRLASKLISQVEIRDPRIDSKRELR